MIEKPLRVIKKHNIIIAVILSVLTIGIYGLYWTARLNNDINAISGQEHAMPGILVVFCKLVTLNIYGWYWAWRMGERIDRVSYGKTYNRVLYMALSIFCLDLVAMCLMQKKINKIVRTM